eukprot:scaffold48876_cov40-Cyclotella_meneghiniana.AAC.1
MLLYDAQNPEVTCACSRGVEAVVEQSPHDRMAGRHYGMMSQVFVERRGPICSDVAARVVNDQLFVVAAGFI